MTRSVERSRGPARSRRRRSWQAATLRSRRPTATPPYRPTSRPCRAGNATSGVASTRAHRAHRPRRAQGRQMNSPFYGIEGQGWFLNFHCFTKYVKVTFSAERCCVHFRPSSSRTQTRATSTSTRTTSSTRSSWRAGSATRRDCFVPAFLAMNQRVAADCLFSRTIVDLRSRHGRPQRGVCPFLALGGSRCLSRERGSSPATSSSRPRVRVILSEDGISLWP